MNRWRPVLVSITISKDCPQNGHAMVPDISTPNGNPVSAQRKPALAHRLLISHFLPGFLRCGHPKNTFAAMKDIPQMACRGELTLFKLGPDLILGREDVEEIRDLVFAQ